MKTRNELYNSSEEVVAYELICNGCGGIVYDNWPYWELEDDYLCSDCIKDAFFYFFDLYSIPMLPEARGMFKYTSKAAGRRSPIPKNMRDRVFKRDKYTCKHCGCKDKKKLTVDHIHPYARGGEDRLSNFQTLCRSCNSKKGIKDDKYIRQALSED